MGRIGVRRERETTAKREKKVGGGFYQGGKGEVER